MKIIDKLIQDGIIKEEEKEEVMFGYCPSYFGYKNHHVLKDIEECKNCWNRDVEEWKTEIKKNYRKTIRNL